MTAIAVTIAGSDSGGGAGIQADLKTFSALGVYGASVITALTAQNTLGVNAIHAAPADFVRAEIDAVFSDLEVGAVKIGMLADAEVIAVVADGLGEYAQERVVLDPVMVATSGDMLLETGAVQGLRDLLFPLATIITPNLPEASWLLERTVEPTRESMLVAARELLSLGPKAVLIKGGHGDGAESTDLLLDDHGPRWLTARRHPTENTHGTGCTLSSAIAAGLAKGADLETAVADAKAYVTAAIIAADRLKIGEGHGPVHHFHAWW
jgi:hydroxymethylpyrimidine/phosphomethylpyrimidine kinase